MRDFCAAGAATRPLLLQAIQIVKGVLSQAQGMDSAISLGLFFPITCAEYMAFLVEYERFVRAGDLHSMAISVHMSETITTGPGDALHALAQRDCRIVLRALGTRGDRHAGIHRARKTIRRLRAMLALGAARFGADGDAIDRRLQRLAAGLSTLRDAQAVTETADSIACGDDAAQWRRLARRLARRRDRLLQQALADDPGFGRRRERLRGTAAAIDALPWRALRPGDVRKALARGERRVAKARKQATKEPTPQQLHRWRRRIRKLRLQVDAARAPDAAAPALPAALARKPGKQARALKKLADRLGRYQDLRILHRALNELPDTVAISPLRARLRREMKHAKPETRLRP